MGIINKVNETERDMMNAWIEDGNKCQQVYTLAADTRNRCSIVALEALGYAPSMFHCKCCLQCA